MRFIHSTGAAALFGLSLTLVGCGGGSETATASSPSVQLTTQARILSVPAALSAPSTTVVSLIKVGETRVGRTVYDYVFKISIQNGAIPRSAIMATATGAGKGTTIIDGSVLVGDIASEATITPPDTVTLRHDRTFPFDASALRWEISDPINGFAVPPEPNAALNDATLAGVDTNGNGVRDDVERKIAKSLSVPNDFTDAKLIAKIHQERVSSPRPDTRFKAIGTMTRIACLAQRSSPAARLLDFDEMTANTVPRQAALRAFYDVLIAFSARELQSCAT